MHTRLLRPMSLAIVFLSFCTPWLTRCTSDTSIDTGFNVLATSVTLLPAIFFMPGLLVMFGALGVSVFGGLIYIVLSALCLTTQRNVRPGLRSSILLAAILGYVLNSAIITRTYTQLAWGYWFTLGGYLVSAVVEWLDSEA